MQTNAQYTEDWVFRKACADLGVKGDGYTPIQKPTKRQASKFRRGMGRVYKNMMKKA